MRFFVVSDIHGHRAPLEALLKEADALGFDQLIACGDHCYPGPEPLAVWKILASRNAICVQGLTDRAISQLNPAKLTPRSEAEIERVERLQRTRQELGDIILARLNKLPREARLPLESGKTMLVVHGTPVDMSDSFSRESTEEEIAAMVGDQGADLIVCGSSHDQFEGTVFDMHIVSVGSVGESPGGTHAQGALIESTQVGYKVTMVSVPLERA